MINPLFYNPFVRVNETLLYQLVASGRPHVILQRFEWPGVPSQKGFMMSAYDTFGAAQLHQNELAEKEGKLFSLLDNTQMAKLIDLVKTSSAFYVFYNGTLDKRNEKRLQKSYAKQTHHYIKTIIRMPNYDGYAVRIYVEYGRVKGEVISGEHRHTNLFYKLVT